MTLGDEAAVTLCPLPAGDRLDLLRRARRSIATVLGVSYGGEEPAPHSAILCAPGAAFVSLHMGEVLRGCVGGVEAIEPLYRAVAKNARAAAFEDPRFPPLTPEEFCPVHIEISRLGPLRRARPEEVVPGTHGVYVVHGARRALLLPQVAPRFGWTAQRLLRETCSKAGLAREAWRDPRVEIYIFAAEIFAEMEDSL